ncbi:sugar ABC transporter ATP-binding protein [Rhizobium rhizogenes]|uniref:sugar ABC transporter ATP-binding protein n=1 Tax=Rhizobium rhizogenes TaxID=359 RepID=UPI0015718AE8|nr:sugar ABC transporter ATP-binding protein [Rhizobium rhizogenes]NTI24436.1 sugar ABC transporter ATP-binding protein [Rhizobium rhizogenes]QTG08185.1 sugar ABC transporter ATP-binding protein [Rhizobium rhizogenes]
MQKIVFEARGVSKSFGPVQVLDDVSLSLKQGEVLGLIGANGAGKSTLMKILAGSLRPSEGEILLDGKPCLMNSMQEAWAVGIGFVSQELNLFPALTILENLALVPGQTGSMHDAALQSASAATLMELGLTLPLDIKVQELSLADRQLVEIARALLRNPRVLILDEPTSALHPAETERLHDVIRKLREGGVAIIYISHFLEHLLDIADDFAVLRDGRRINFLTRKERPTVPELVEAMLGSRPAAATVAPLRKERGAGLVALEIADATTRSGLSVDQLRAESGEVVGIAGHVGAGPEDLFQLLFGRLPLKSGKISLPSGQVMRPDTPAAVQAGVAYFPADRKRLGLTLRQSIRDNISAVRSLSLGRDGLLPSARHQSNRAEERGKTIGIKMSSIDQVVGELSGGNQQKVVFARWLEARPSLLLLDDPMRGVDVNAKRQIAGIIHDLLNEPRVILFHSTDPADYVAIAHRVIIFVDGTTFCELSGEQLTEHNLVAAMNGIRVDGGDDHHQPHRSNLASRGGGFQ